MPSRPTSRITCRCRRGSRASARSSSTILRDAKDRSWQAASRYLLDIDCGGSSDIPPNIIHVLVMHYREQPGSEVGAGLPEVAPRTVHLPDGGDAQLI